MTTNLKDKKPIAAAAEADKAKAKDEKPAPPKKTALEEDDEFEDFPADIGWEQVVADEKVNAWEATWEDDDEFEDFAKVLKTEQTKRTGVAPMKM
ncbi:hypothetical protein HDU67_000688 [Dinochytrium kinnereticum]|nr:hypothetical protein HDU67_000688 [Dinochytrium kinnereticum]